MQEKVGPVLRFDVGLIDPLNLISQEVARKFPPELGIEQPRN